MATPSNPLSGPSIPDGMLQQGNIDVNHRPIVWNDNGTPSTIYSVTVPVDKDGSVWQGEYEKAPRYALVPTIVNGRFLTSNGKIPVEGDKKAQSALEDAATSQYQKSHQHLGVFSSSDAADKYAEATHGWMPNGSSEKVYLPSYSGDSNMPLTRKEYEQALARNLQRYRMPDNPLAGTQAPVLPSQAQLAAQQQNVNAQPNADVNAPVSMPQQGPSVPQTAQPNVQEAHHSLLGKAFYAIADPQQGTGSPTQRLFKNILAGAMIGAAHGGNSGSGWNAAANGMAATDARQQQNAEIARQQHQQDFENDLRTKAEQRAQQGFETEEQLRKAQLAEANTQTLRMNQLIQGESFDMHDRMAKSGLLNVMPYKDAGLSPIVDGMSESDMHQYLKDHPGSTTLDWEATGTKMGVGPDGKPTYESTYSAYDPKGKLTVSRATIDQWQKDGVFDRFPEYKQILDRGQQIPATAYISMKRNADVVRADNFQRQKDDLGVREGNATINAKNAEAAHWLAETKKTNAEIKEAALGKNQQQQFDKALQELNDKKGDFDAISPASRVVIAESMNKMVPALTAVYKQQLADTLNPESQQEAGETLKQIQNLTSLGQRALMGHPGAGGAADPIQKTVDMLKGKTPEEVAISLNDPKNGVPDAAKAEIWKKLGMTPPQAQPSTLGGGTVGMIGSAVKKVADAGAKLTAAVE